MRRFSRAGGCRYLSAGAAPAAGAASSVLKHWEREGSTSGCAGRRVSASGTTSPWRAEMWGRVAGRRADRDRGWGGSGRPQPRGCRRRQGPWARGSLRLLPREEPSRALGSGQRMLLFLGLHVRPSSHSLHLPHARVQVRQQVGSTRSSMLIHLCY